MAKEKSYPDITDILARKERGRRALASLSFAEKLEILDRMREAATAFKADAPAKPTRQQG